MVKDARKIAEKEGRIGNLESDMVTLRIDNRRARGGGLSDKEIRPSDAIRLYNSFKIYYYKKRDNDMAIKKIKDYLSKH